MFEGGPGGLIAHRAAPRQGFANNNLPVGRALKAELANTDVG